MKVKINQCVTGIKGNQPYIAFSISGKEYDRVKDYHGKDLKGYVIDVYKPKRSSEANAYMWQLIGEIAEKSGTPEREVYRHAVREAGIYEDLMLKADGLEVFKESWESNGIAWLIEYDPPQSEYVHVRAYYGSSAYNSKQMSKLIDYVVSEAKFWNIETLTPDELASMKARTK